MSVEAHTPPPHNPNSQPMGSTNAFALPPGPKFALPHLLGYFRAPLSTYRKLAAVYGDPFTVPFMLGERMVVTGAPDGIRQIFGAPAEAYEVVHPAVRDFMGPQSLLGIEGEAHRTARAALAPPFHPQRQQDNAPLFRDVALRQAAKWPHGRAIVMIGRMRRISLEIILRTVLGVAEEHRITALAEAFLALHDKVGFWIVFIPALRCDLGPLSPWGRFVRARDRLTALLKAEIAVARAALAGSRDDILTHMVSLCGADGDALMGDSEIRDHLITILSAGLETTATALSWAFYWLERDTSMKARLLSELAEYRRHLDTTLLHRLPYLDAVCRETLRIHPVAVTVARRLKHPMTLRGYPLPPNTVVSASVHLAHHNPATYPDPDLFRPERFLGCTYGAAEFLPFGGGRRHCLGVAMGLEEMKVVLASILACYELRLLDCGPLRPVWKGGLMGPKGGVRILVEGSRAAA